MTTISSPASPAPGETPESPAIPKGSTPEDDLENNALYQSFLKREAAVNPDPQPEAPATAAPTSEGVEDAGTDSGGGGSVAPSASPPDTSIEGDLPSELNLPPEPDGIPQPNQPDQPQPESISYNGQTYTPDQFEQIVGLAQWASQLNPTQAAYIDGVISGQIPVDPQQLQSLMQPQAPTSGPLPNTPPLGQPLPTTPITPPPSPQPQPLPPVDDDYEYADPRLKQELDYLRSQVTTQQQQYDQWQAQQQQFYAQQQQQTQAQIATQIDEGARAFQDQFNLTDEAREELVQSAVTLQVLPQLAAQSTPDQAIQRAMEYAFWADPKYRQAAIEAQAAEVAQQQETQEVRKTKASALSSSGGTTPRPETSGKLTGQQRQAAMAEEIRQSQNGLGAQV